MEAAIPRFSILIVNFNGLAHLEECLSSIAGQDFRDYEVILVDNASSDGSVEYVHSRHPSVKIVSAPRNLGFAGGNNLGLLHCAGDSVLFLNNDTRMEPGCLRELARAGERHPGVRVFQALLIDYFDTAKVDSAGDTLYTTFFSFSFTGYPARHFPEERPVAGACAAAALYSRKLLDELGGFDEDLFLVYEDLDLSFRARHRGEEILLIPAARVLHKRSASMGKRSALGLYYSERNLPLFALKNLPLGLLLRLLPGLLFMKAFNFAVSLRMGMPGAYWKATWDSVRMVPAVLRKRRRILSSSRLSASQVAGLLRKGWLRERLDYRKGRFGSLS